MLNWIKSSYKKRVYRTNVIDGMMVLLQDLGDPGLKKMVRAYPGIEVAIANNFEDGNVTPERTAIHVTTTVITHIIETQISEETRNNVLEQLKVLTVLKDEEKEPFIQRIEWITSIAEDWIKDGTLERPDLDIMLDEIIGALKGVEAHEREKDFIMSALYRGLFPDKE